MNGLRIMHEEYGDSLRILVIKDIRTYDKKSMENLKSILKVLINEEKLYFEFLREEFSLEEDELEKYRSEIPQYFKKNGKYEVKFALNESIFRSIGYLPVNDDTFNEMLVLWEYFENIVFFIPNSTLSWQDFNKKIARTKPEIHAVDFIRNNYAKSVLIKGYDGDNLTFIYSKDFDEKLVSNIIEITKEL